MERKQRRAGKGPGRNERIGISLEELFNELFPDEKAARVWVEELRWGPNGEDRCCPHCGSLDTYTTKSGRPQPYRCRDCKQWFSVRVGTIMQSSNLPLRKWVIAVYLMATSLKGVSSMKLRRDLGITQKTAWMLAHKIRQGWLGATDFGQLDGTLEADETYIGGLEKNKHWDKKLRKGRGTAGKIAVAGIKSRRSKQLRLAVINSPSSRELKSIVRRNAKPGSTLYTDELPSYEGMSEFAQASVAHSRGEYVRDNVHINGMESCWAPIKRSHKGVHHHWSRKHLQKYMDEFAGRNNCRKLDTIDIMRLLFLGFEGRLLPWKKLVKGS